MLWSALYTGPTLEGTGSRVQLVGDTSTGIQAEIADVTFPVLTATNELYVIDTTNSQPGSTLLVEKTKDNIISLAILLKAGFKVDYVETPQHRATAYYSPAKSWPCGELP